MQGAFTEALRLKREREIKRGEREAGLFLRDIAKVCRHHGFALPPEFGRKFVVETLDPGESLEALRDSLMGDTVQP